MKQPMQELGGPPAGITELALPATGRPVAKPLEVPACMETDVAGGATAREQALHLLARWLVSAAQKAVPTGTGGDPADPRIPVDVADDPKVGLDGQ